MERPGHDWFSDLKIEERYNREVYQWFSGNMRAHLGSMPWIKDFPLAENVKLRARALREVISRLRTK